MMTNFKAMRRKRQQLSEIDFKNSRFIWSIINILSGKFGSLDKVRGKANQISTIRGRKRTECPLLHAVGF